MEAIVFNIQRFSLHDGDGIRTLVFFKGCPLRCAWCSNPESQSPLPQLMYNKKLCINCGGCSNACPATAVAAGENEPELLRDRCRGLGLRDRCRGLGLCAVACPTGALRLAGRRVSLEDLLEQVLQDRLFFRQSGGGVTLSGGEALMQGEFCRAFLKELKDNGIHTAVETCGLVPWPALEKVLPLVDQFLFDYKIHAPEKHRLHTGSGNSPIIRNLRRLKSAGASIILRLPLVPGANMDQEHYDGVASLATELELPALELLPFHQYGRGKYAELGRPYAFPDCKPPDKDAMEQAKTYLASRTRAVIL